MSIASRVNREFYGDDYDKGLILIEATVVEHAVSTIVAGRPEVARELAAVLLRLERGMNSPTRSSSIATVNTIGLLVDPAFKSRESQHVPVLKTIKAGLFRRLEVY